MSGISHLKGSMVAIATPMLLNGDIDYESLEKLIEFHILNDGNWFEKCSGMLVYPLHTISNAESDFNHSYSVFENADSVLRNAIFNPNFRNFISCYR